MVGGGGGGGGGGGVGLILWCPTAKTKWSQIGAALMFLKDRQQEEGPVLVAARYNEDYYIPNGVIYMYYICFISLFYGRYIYIKHVKITWTDAIWA